MTTKRYGLILPSIKKPMTLGKRKMVLQFESDEEIKKCDKSSSMDWVNSTIKKSVGHATMKASQKKNIQEAQQQDPTVFQYDEIYDDMKRESEVKRMKINGGGEKKSRYIGNILAQSAKRKIENERRIERKVQRERDEEGNEFADKESFVSASFLKKLEVLKEADEHAKKENSLEELHDVTKHKNFGVFYNHILDQTLESVEITAVNRQDNQSKKDIENRNDFSGSSRNENEVKEMLSTSACDRTMGRVHKRSRQYSSSISSPSDRNSSYMQKNSRDETVSDYSVFTAKPPTKFVAQSSETHSKPLTKKERILEITKSDIIAKRTIGDVFKMAVERYFNRRDAL